jgi:hypothetical protein
MKTRPYRSIALSAGFALGLLTLGGAAAADETPATRAFFVQSSPSAAQQNLAATTQKLEDAFNGQFVRGKIDRAALSGAIDDVVEAMPEAARPKVKDHIELVLQTGEKLVTQLTPEQRAAAVAPPAAERVGRTQQAQVAAWGYPGVAGFGGYGAFGFPAMYSLGTGYNTAYNTSSGTSYSTTSGYSTGYNTGYSSSCGLGYGALGCGGWYW